MVGLRAKLVNALVATKNYSGRRAPVWAVSLFLVSLGLCFVPLYNLLGYDFAFVIGLVAAFAAVDVGQGEVNRARATSRTPSERRVWNLVLRACATAFAIVLVPLAIITANALRVPNCNFATGLAFFALLPISTAVLAAALGALAGIVSVRRGRAMAFALPLASMAWAAARLYVQPPVYAFDVFGGFFPGPIYDEALTPPARLVYFRAANVLWVVTLVALTEAFTSARGSHAPHLSVRAMLEARRLGLMTVPRATALVALVLASLGAVVASGPLGFHRSQYELTQSLSRTHTTQHFVVHSSPSDGETSADIALFLRELEFRHHQLSQILQTQPQRPVRVFLFPNAEAKKDLVGAGATLFAKPWREEIYIQVDAFPPAHLRHELAHVFAASFGDPVFGISLRWLPWPRLASGLVEGIAEAADYSDPQGSATLHQDARMIVESGQAPPLRHIMGAGFSIAAGPKAYTLAASFTHFLLHRFGASRLAEVYRSGGDYNAAYGQPLSELEDAWKAFLLQQPVDDDQRATAQEHFRRPAIFKKVCARELAARLQEATRLRSSEPEKAVALIASVCSDDPGEPSYALSLAYAQAAAKQPQAAAATLEALLQRQDLTRPMQRRVASLKASLAVLNRNIDEATAAETTAFRLSTEQGDRRASLARLRALQDPRALGTLGRVLFGDNPSASLDPGLVLHLLNEFAHDFPDEALGPYLVGRQLVERDPVLAFSTLEKACPLAGDTASRPLPTPLPPLFLRECLRLRGQSAYRAGAYENAAAAWRASQTQATNEAERLRGGDALERIEWTKQHRGPL